MPESSSQSMQFAMSRYDRLPTPVKLIFLAFTIIGIVFFLIYLFSWYPFGWVLTSFTFYYILYAVFFSTAFLVLPMLKRHAGRVPWFDYVLAVLALGMFSYLAVNAREITEIGWLASPKIHQKVIAGIIGVMAIEGGRRMAGWPFALICLAVGTYPLYAHLMPGIFWGMNFSFFEIVTSFVYGSGGINGLPARVVGEILFGFLIFAGMLLATGAGKFFLDLATAMMGRFRGGPAKIAVVASGFLGSLTGTPIENIVATGSFTIPAMKQMGYPKHYAGAIEAVASSGGVIMPPVMGAIAFIMAIITDIPYSEILIAAIIPALLYYWGLLVQVDAYAARVGLKGLPKADIPRMGRTLATGWPYLVVLIFMVIGLVYFRWGAKAPVYASGMLLGFSILFTLLGLIYRRYGAAMSPAARTVLYWLSEAHHDSWMTPKTFANNIATIGGLVAFMIAGLAAVGLLLTGLQITGTLTSLTASIVSTASGNLALILIITVVICYVFGMVGVALIAYIVLATIAAPAVVAATGMNLLAMHLFMIYYLLTSGITPPVAVAAFVAAGMAGGPPMKTGFPALRLAIVLYFIPFFFLFNPSLILQGDWRESLYLFAFCLLGITVLGGALEGYLVWVGRLRLWARPVLVISGFLIAFPDWLMTFIGLGVTAAVVAVILLRGRRGAVDTGEAVDAT